MCFYMKKNKTILPIVLIFVSIASSALIHHVKGAENPFVLVSDGKTDTSISLSWEVEEIKWGINFEIYSRPLDDHLRLEIKLYRLPNSPE